jgi:hypothetical protein
VGKGGRAIIYECLCSQNLRHLRHWTSKPNRVYKIRMTQALSLMTLPPSYINSFAAPLHLSAGWRRDPATRKQPRLPVVSVGKRWMRASDQAGLRATLGSELSGPRWQMNVIRQQKQTKPVVEHKGVYPRLGSEAVIDLGAQSLTWDTFWAVGSQICLVGVLPQSSQQLAWDTLSHTRITDEIAGILITFHFVRAIRLIGRLSQDIRRILQKFLSRTVADPQFKKTLSRCGFLVAYRIEGLK